MQYALCKSSAGCSIPARPVSIVRAPRPDSRFLIVRNSVAQDERLSYRARGLLVAILSRPDHWRVDSTQLAREAKEGRDAVRSALKELETCGYLRRVTTRDENGRWVTDQVVYDTPQDETAGHTGDGFPVAGKPGAGKPVAVERTETKNYEQDEMNGGSAPRSPSDGPWSNWRDDDRRPFLDTIGSEHIVCDGTGPWREGRFPTAALYDAMRKDSRRFKAKKWPGQYLGIMHDWEDYLAGLGIRAD